jgi:lipoprotein NlpI
LAFFLGSETQSAVLASAASSDKGTERNQQCEAGLYLGEWNIAYRHESDAKPLFQQAASQCPENFIEYQPAHAEWKKMSQGSEK